VFDNWHYFWPCKSRLASERDGSRYWSGKIPTFEISKFRHLKSRNSIGKRTFCIWGARRRQRLWFSNWPRVVKNHVHSSERASERALVFDYCLTLARTRVRLSASLGLVAPCPWALLLLARALSSN